ncbi:2-hydroxyacyl-CoA dehydratase family protein [Treponema sp. TIM-1]|uniref:2-hydroxyacyl-CoA dehydratase family protein n=1 Tax=Treponema sp. TIM-1 TaxID=2898417 RepID=UPI00397FB77A
MRDLKHLIYFEKLLETTNNELIQQAKAEGKLAIGYTCFHMPEVILNVDRCFPVRLRAPNTGSMDIATYYMSNYTCEYCRALLERAFEGGLNFLDGLAAVDACAQMNRLAENIEIQKLVDKDKFFVTHADIPYKVEPFTIKHYTIQMRNRVLNVLKDTYGVDTSDEALRGAVDLHNQVCGIISEIGELRKADNPVITGYEFHIINLVSYACPKYLLLDKLRETLEELKTREPDPTPRFRARVELIGSEIDDPELTKLIEEAGALVVADRYCFGSTPGREVISLNDTEEVLTQICRHYLEVSECPRYISNEKVAQRRKTVDALAREFKADGIIFEQIKFCDYWGFERALAAYIQEKEYDHPVLSIDRPYMTRASGQLRTRVQAFVESLEIKKINKLKEVV